MEAQREEKRMQMEYEFKRWQAELDARTKIMVAEISSKAKVDSAEISAATDAVEGDATETPADEPAETPDQNEGVMSAIQQLADQVAELQQEISAPVQYERGKDGKVTSITKGKRKMSISYGPDGRMQGVQ
jgi:C1A family cysteine protease